MARPKNPKTTAKWFRVPIGVDMTIKDVAEYAGVSTFYVNMICRGERPKFPFPHKIRKLGGRYIIRRLPVRDKTPTTPDPDTADWTS